MAKLNNSSIIGNLGKDPVLNTTNTAGKSVCNLRVAVNESWTDKATNQKVEKTEWFTVVCWGKLAENVCQYTRSGSLVYVEGRMQKGRAYMGKAIDQAGHYEMNADGSHHMVQMTGMEIVASNVQFLEKKPTDTAYAANGQAVAPAAAAAAPAAVAVVAAPPVAAPVAPAGVVAPVAAVPPGAQVATPPVQVVATPEAVSGTFVQPPAGV